MAGDDDAVFGMFDLDVVSDLEADALEPFAAEADVGQVDVIDAAVPASFGHAREIAVADAKAADGNRGCIVFHTAFVFTVGYCRKTTADAKRMPYKKSMVQGPRKG